MKKFLRLIPALFILFSVVSCNKDKSQKWLSADIEVRDGISGELINADLELHFRYEDKNYTTDEYEIEQLGSTTDGTYKLEKEFSEKIKKAYLIAYGNEYYYSEGTFQQESDPTYVDVFNKTGKIVLYLHPIYRMEVSFKNVNCFDATDSLRVVIDDPQNKGESILDTLTGCYDGTPLSLPIWSRSSYLPWAGFLKRNGTQSVLETVYNFEPYTVNQLLIEY